MKATLVDIEPIADNTYHNAFTSICRWRGNWYCAFRTAMSHDIVPPGMVTLCINETGSLDDWDEACTFVHTGGDLRDPKLIASDAALYLMCGVYLPHPAQSQQPTTLSNRSHENILQTLVSHTTDGHTWSACRPILRPNHWGWSAVPTSIGWMVAAYAHGLPKEAQSLTLWGGKSLWDVQPLGTIYEGVSFAMESGESRTPHMVPNEAVLYQPVPGTLACCVRTEDRMDWGIATAHSAYQDWRWLTVQVDLDLVYHTISPALLHPSSVLETPYGWLLAARHCWPVFRSQSQTVVDHYRYSTRLYHLNGHHADMVLTLPGEGDCGYAGLCDGSQEGEVFVSYYTQGDAVPKDRFGVAMPGAVVQVATVRIEA